MARYRYGDGRIGKPLLHYDMAPPLTGELGTYHVCFSKNPGYSARVTTPRVGLRGTIVPCSALLPDRLLLQAIREQIVHIIARRHRQNRQALVSIVNVIYQSKLRRSDFDFVEIGGAG